MLCRKTTACQRKSASIIGFSNVGVTGSLSSYKLHQSHICICVVYFIYEGQNSFITKYNIIFDKTAIILIFVPICLSCLGSFASTGAVVFRHAMYFSSSSNLCQVCYILGYKQYFKLHVYAVSTNVTHHLTLASFIYVHQNCQVSIFWKKVSVIISLVFSKQKVRKMVC